MAMVVYDYVQYSNVLCSAVCLRYGSLVQRRVRICQKFGAVNSWGFCHRTNVQPKSLDFEAIQTLSALHHNGDIGHRGPPKSATSSP